MIPWLQIDTARVPGADVELRLMRRGDEFSMMLGPNELMNSRLSGSEEALATLVCRRIEAVRAPHLLIGGLGMGFTLRAALAVLGSEARIVVAELVPAVIAWARGPMAGIFGNSLSRSARAPCERRRHGGDLIACVGIRCDPARCRQRPRGPGSRGQRCAVQSEGIESDPAGIASGRRSRRLVVGAEPVIFQAAWRCRLRCQRSCRARHDKT